MNVISFGKSRESATRSSEEYKRAIRLWFESQGYAQTLDSYAEGCKIDMVFEPAWTKSTDRIWVEAKNEDVSLSDKGFGAQVIGYLLNWLVIPERRRPEMNVFVRTAKNITRWDAIFGPGLEENVLIEWMKNSVDNPETLEDLLQSKKEDIMDFFRLVQVFEGNESAIESDIEQKRRTSAAGTERIAERRRTEIQRRCTIGHNPCMLISNLVPMSIPGYLVILEFEPQPWESVRAKLKGQYTPPYAQISSGRILTLDVLDLEKHFRNLMVRSVNRHPTIDIEKAFSRQLMRLLNECISRIIYCKGGKTVKQNDRFVSIFPPVRALDHLTDMVIPGQQGKNVTITTPMYRRDNQERATAENTCDINHVFHKGIIAKAATYWGEYYTSLRLKRVYTSDGILPLDSTSTNRLDSKYRKSLYGRSASQLSTIRGYSNFLFQDRKHWVRQCPDWLNQFRFGTLLEVSTHWAPVHVPEGVAALDEFDLDMQYGESTDEDRPSE